MCQFSTVPKRNRDIEIIMSVKLPDFLFGIWKIVLEAGLFTLLNLFHEDLTETEHGIEQQDLHYGQVQFPSFAIISGHSVSTCVDITCESDVQKQIFTEN